MKNNTNTNTSELEIRVLKDRILETIEATKKNSTIEAELLRKKLIKSLYKALGDPTEKDFPAEFKHAWKFKRMNGYTTDIKVEAPISFEFLNGRHTDWRIQRPSKTKCKIVEEYVRDGWTCTVRAYNVMCVKYVPHPRYKGIWVRFYVSRDVAKYEYVLELTND